jgi:hypothetical protein
MQSNLLQRGGNTPEELRHFCARWLWWTVQLSEVAPVEFYFSLELECSGERFSKFLREGHFLERNHQFFCSCGVLQIHRVNCDLLVG